MTYYIKVPKIDYYSWKIMAIVLLFFVIFLLYYIQNISTVGEVNDDYWHKGYNDCINNFNISSNEQAMYVQWKMNKVLYYYMQNYSNASECFRELNGSYDNGWCYYTQWK